MAHREELRERYVSLVSRELANIAQELLQAG